MLSVLPLSLSHTIFTPLVHFSDKYKLLRPGDGVWIVK